MSLSPFSLFGEARIAMPVFEGSISRAPASRTDFAYATSPHMPGQQAELGPMSWPRDGLHLPEVGDAVLIAWPESGNPWIVGWEPSA